MASEYIQRFRENTEKLLKGVDDIMEAIANIEALGMEIQREGLNFSTRNEAIINGFSVQVQKKFNQLEAALARL